MKKNLNSSDNMFKSKGFYVALYSCMGVLLVGALAVSYNIMRNTQQVDTIDIDTMYPTMSPITRSYALTEQELNNNYYYGGISDFFNGDDDEGTVEKQPEEVKTTEPQTEIETTSPSIEEIEADPVFNVFGDNDQMIWPTSGEVVMSYSTDSMVFDETLNQFRTNDTINIAAAQGAKVRASADGIVSSVSHTRRDGNKVTIEHGNGWTTTYSQLQDNILVSKGDVVLAGEVIGEVGTPSIFTSALGYNVGFKVTQGYETVDPLLVLE